MQYLITGAKGQLGTELTNLLTNSKANFVAYDSSELDITNRELVAAKVNEVQPQVIFHCAAYTAVDKAEDEGKEINWRVNVDGTRNIAKAAKNVGATVVYISTDYVFDGQKETEYQVDDPTNPLNEYGKAKLAGEQAIQQAMTDYYIIRTSWVFGEFGKNFVYTMLNLAKTHDQLTVVNDQTGRPTWTRTLAEFMVYLIDHQCEFGVYQLSNDNSATWYEFASEILKNQAVKVSPVTSAQFPQKATRPQHSIMSLDKVKQTGFAIPTWQESLSDFLQVVND
ncbi:dTDP-4-dehydrorhamnose reductase [Paucilactobacillus kaifaensis]|uniref:dTDP-4-dehydrorhamnose reductase n=1 Tax=Paucilactobacillus kaifaensis TaxID=2559921 RepID=UPI0010F69F15|nr:dTDP-4-dehydrorhamnose reductase [Paucilactobacillus kaifaensis]